MKKIYLILSVVMLTLGGGAIAQQKAKCGMETVEANLIAKDPAWKQRFIDQRASLQGIADDYMRGAVQGAAERTTTGYDTVPVIFHIIVDSAQFAEIGGYYGIANRCDSQIAILNRDFNRQNPDSTLIPWGWKPYFGSSGIHFALAHTNPSGYGSPGFEVRITSSCGFSDIGENFAMAKTSTDGLASWDVTKYYNVWCVSFADNTTCTPSGTLGITVPLSFTAGGAIPVAQEGVCMLYKTLGNDGTGTGASYTPYNLGRTLTHETGHFFEIWHVWGDDSPGNDCPWNGGSDDGLADTPPQSQATYGNPVYSTSLASVGGTFHDGCEWNGTTEEQPIGVACLSYLDYTDDAGMLLFTPMQCAAMASMVLVPPSHTTGATGQGMVGENYSLVQHPSLLYWPADAQVLETTLEAGLNIFPNPTTGKITLTFDGSINSLQDVVVINIVGQQVLHSDMSAFHSDIYSLDLSGMSKGIYFVKCNFASGNVIRKIVLQ